MTNEEMARRRVLKRINDPAAKEELKKIQAAAMERYERRQELNRSREAASR